MRDEDWDVDDWSRLPPFAQRIGILIALIIVGTLLYLYVTT